MLGQRILVVLILLIAGFGFLFSMWASYPGYLNPDSVSSIRQAEFWRFDDWHSPFVSLLWSGLYWLIRDFGVVIGFNNILIWGGAAGLALALRHRIGRSSLLIAGLPGFPGLFNLLGNVAVDVLLVAWLMAASWVAYLSNRHTVSSGVRRWLTLTANTLILCAFMTRLNAVFCLVPLLLYTNARFGLRKNLLTCAMLLALMPVAYLGQNAVLEVKSLSPSDSIKVFDLLALSEYQNQNLMPGQWTAGQSNAVTDICYSPIQWDSAWSGQCSFLYQQLSDQGYWGDAKLTKAWLLALLHHPLGYFQMRAATFQRAMHQPNGRNMLYNTSPNRWNWEVALNLQRPAPVQARAYIRSDANDALSRPAWFVAISALALVLLFRFDGARTPEGRFALAVLLSGLIYLLSYFPLAVSVEYRYFYWAGFASYLGLIIALTLAITRPPLVREEPLGDCRHAPLRGAALMLVALAGALTAFPLQLPTVSREIKVTALTGPVRLESIRSAAMPKWMWFRFEGKLEAGGWQPWELGYRSPVSGEPLRLTLNILNQNIDVTLASGPDMGVALVEAESGFRHQVDTRAIAPGKIVVVVPALPPANTGNLAVVNFLAAALCFVVFLWLLLWLTPGGHRQPRMSG